MNITGVIVEYNPFHNGHAFHLHEAKKQTDADLIVAVMSGNFLQRGEPALVSKWSRTKMALAAGVDIVIELPYAYATQHAEIFAQGAVSLLQEIGATSLCFGSEAGNIEQFLHLHNFLASHNSLYNQFVQNAIKEGISYPKALALAFSHIKNDQQLLDLTQPNNILGYHYVKAIVEQASTIKPFTVQRNTAQYHDNQLSELAIASATSIRAALFSEEGHLPKIKHVVPQTTYDELLAYHTDYKGFQHWEQLFPYLKYKVSTTPTEQLANIYEAEEGLENRVMQTIATVQSFQQFMKALKTKRYTWTRLQRFCLHILTNTTKEEMQQVSRDCPYIRILGMNKNGRSYLNKRKKQLNIPLITTISKHCHAFLEIEKRAAACYSLGYEPELQEKLIKQEYAMPPILSARN